MDRDSIQQMLSNSWFNGISNTHINNLLERCTLRSLNDHDPVYLSGVKSHNVYLIVKGRIKFTILSSSGSEFVLAVWEQGRCFGESALSEDGIMPLEARADGETSVLAMPTLDIKRVLGPEFERFQANISKDLIERSKQMYKIVDVLLFSSLESRIASRLLNLLQQYGVKKPNCTQLTIQINQAEIAKMTGGSRQRVNKVLSRWNEEGLIGRKNQIYDVYDVEELKRIATNPD